MDSKPTHINRKAYYIKVPYGVQKRLSKLFKVSPATISETLMMKHRGKNYKEIIRMAVEMGGEWVNGNA